MDLFEHSIDKTKNWLPKDGAVNYYGKLYNRQEADDYLEKLLRTIAWRNDEAIIFGKKIVTKRKKWRGMAKALLGTRIPTPRNTLCRGPKNCWSSKPPLKKKRGRPLIRV